MKELFEKLNHTNEFSNGILIDTCFFIYLLEHSKEKELLKFAENNNVAITSFNVDEFLFKEHSVENDVREHARRFLKKNSALVVFDINVHPGNKDQEKSFVNSVEPDLLKEIPDPSDAVLMAAAILSHSSVLTKDKHHLFTTKLENYLNRYRLKVFKELHDVTGGDEQEQGR
ncbi:MAG: PIN domain-containing protein [Candidatus Woesearchaeota archaeon]